MWAWRARTTRIVRHLIVAGLLCGLAASAALAQVAVPGPVAPGQIQRQLQPPPAPPPVAPPTPTPAPVQPPIAAPSGLKFTLKDVVIEGSTVYTPDELRPSFQSFLGQPISVDSLPALADAVTVKYRGDGYLLSRAVVAPQTIDPQAGIVRLTVYEGYIDRVQLEPAVYETGEKGALLRSILKRLERACHPGDRTVDGKPCPLHRDVLERYLLLANDLAGVIVSAVIHPAADAPAAAELLVTVAEKPYDASVSLDNLGSRYVGQLRLQEMGALNNSFGLYDRTELQLAESVPFNDLIFVSGVERIPLTVDGLRLAVDFSHSRERPGDVLRPDELRTITDSGGFTLSYPLWRTRSENLLLHGGVELSNSTTAVADQTAFFDQTRRLTLGGTYDLADSLLGVNLVDASVSQGLPILGATAKSALLTSHPGASPAFEKLDLEVSRLQQIVPEWHLLAAASGQYAFSKLLNIEQISFGGERYGRGYDPSEILGDSGILGKLELQYTPGWAPGMFGWRDDIPTLQFYGFYDVGRLWTSPGPSTDLSGASAGGGLRYTITERFSGFVEVARALTRPVQSLEADGQDGKAYRCFFSVAGKF